MPKFSFGDKLKEMNTDATLNNTFTNDMKKHINKWLTKIHT